MTGTTVTMHLANAHKRVLLAIAGPNFLKSHRDIEGNKVYMLHPLEGDEEVISPRVIDDLTTQGLIDSNKKFPAATYWLTDKGKALVEQFRLIRKDS
jgi:hypothetical protein